MAKVVAYQGSPSPRSRQNDPAALSRPSKGKEVNASAASMAAQALSGDQSAVQKLIHARNEEGLELLRSGDSDAAYERFKYAEALLLTNPKEMDNTPLMAVTCNNLGCYYKKVGKHHGALNYLRRALKMEVELSTDEVTLAGTHLNLCAVLSNLQKHDKAVQHALCALDLMTQRVAGSETPTSEDDYAVLAIAYHNVAMERSALNQTEQAATAFQSGYQVASRLLGDSHPLTITLGKNCEVVLQKAKANPKVKMALSRDGRESLHRENGNGNGAAKEGTLLPEIPGAQPESPKNQPISPRGMKKNVRSEAADWIKQEESMWAAFAQQTLKKEPPEPAGGVVVVRPPDAPVEPLDLATPTPRRQQPPLSLTALRDMRETAPVIPQAHDMGDHRFKALAPAELVHKMPLGKALDDNPTLLMDIIDHEEDGNSTILRPNRSMKRSTRTSRVVRGTGVFNSMTHRDRVQEELAKKRSLQNQPWKSAQTQKAAAERIQRVWRQWHQYCQQNSEWMTITWICATMIQSHWRSYRVRRARQDKNAKVIQRHIRGFLVRCVLKNHVAAVNIQRIIVGYLTRKKLRQLHQSAKQIQRLVRGGLARRYYRNFYEWKIGVIITIQQNIRVWLAKRRTEKVRQEKQDRELMLKATTDLQRMFRGYKGRVKAETRQREVRAERIAYNAAIKIQGMFRAKKALKIVEEKRRQHLREMDKAATLVRKMFLGTQTRKRYRELREGFAGAVAEIITIQRYMRGCMTRLRLWREAVRAEEELWAAVEIQRAWRGYQGKVRWEDAYEVMWRREMAAAMLQRNLRGWVARVKVNRMRRKIARAEFEAARRRFRSAQRIQALARGVITRRVERKRHDRIVSAVTHIQRIQRGRALRSRMWNHVINQRAIMIQSAARGFLVRNRRFHMIARVILIQRKWRAWRLVPRPLRSMNINKARRRKEKTILIQRHWRAYSARQEVRRIQNSGHFGSSLRLDATTLPSS